MKNKLLLACIIILLASSCKKWQYKYPEDTDRTKDSPTERLTNKWWTLESVTLNGVDYTDTIKNQFGIYQIYFSQESYNQGFNEVFEKFYGTIKTDFEPEVVSIWGFATLQELALGPLGGNNSNKISLVPCYLKTGSFYLKYEILKLSSNELKFSIKNIKNDTTIINYFKHI